MLDKPEVLAEVTEQPRFLPWVFDTLLESCRGAPSNKIDNNKNKTQI